MASSSPRARKVESVAARSAIQHCSWPSHLAIDSAFNESIEYLVDGSPDNCSWRWGAEPGWGHVHPDERGCGKQHDFWFSPSAVGKLYVNTEAISRRSYGGEAIGG